MDSDSISRTLDRASEMLQRAEDDTEIVRVIKVTKDILEFYLSRADKDVLLAEDMWGDA